MKRKFLLLVLLSGMILMASCGKKSSNPAAAEPYGSATASPAITLTGTIADTLTQTPTVSVTATATQTNTLEPTPEATTVKIDASIRSFECSGDSPDMMVYVKENNAPVAYATVVVQMISPSTGDGYYFTQIPMPLTVSATYECRVTIRGEEFSGSGVMPGMISVADDGLSTSWQYAGTQAQIYIYGPTSGYLQAAYHQVTGADSSYTYTTDPYTDGTGNYTFMNAVIRTVYETDGCFTGTDGNSRLWLESRFTKTITK
jgi:hypothetical protein